MSIPPDPRVVLEISSHIGMLALVDNVTEQFGTMTGLDEDVADGLALVVREAVANAIKHGNAGDVRKRVSIEYALVGDASEPSLVVRVRDEGHGFDVQSLANPLDPEGLHGTSGRGVFLMHAFMDDVQVHQIEGGTEVVMVRVINRAGSAPSPVP